MLIVVSQLGTDGILILLLFISPSPSQEPSTKRVRPLGRVTSLANLISPVKNGAVRRFGQTLQASFRGDGRSPSVPQHKGCSKTAAPTPPKRRNSTLWSETLDVHQKGTFSTKEIKRQEVSAVKIGEREQYRATQTNKSPLHLSARRYRIGLGDLLNPKGLGFGRFPVFFFFFFSSPFPFPLSC